MQRSLYQQAVRMHGQDLSVLTEKHQQENFVFVEDEHEEQLTDVRVEECNQRESSTNHPDTTPVGHYQDGVRLTGTMRDLVHVQSRTTVDSSTEESSKSDTSPEILPLGVPRELHEPFDERPESKTELFKLQNNGFVSKLHNFISKKADILFKATPADKEPATVPNIQDTIDLDYYATLPPMEQFMVVPTDQSRKRLFEILSIGDIIAGSIVAIKDFGMFVQVVCLCGKDPRYLQECDIVGLLPKGELGDRYSQKAQLEDFRAGDVVRCRVVKTDAANEKVILTMINLGEESEGNLLGIISESDLPVHYRRSQTQRETGESYDEMLDNTLGFDNPYNISCLTKMLNIDDTSPPSLMPVLQSANFPEEEHAEALRKWQSHKWAMESVARGVEHFKADRHLEAMQQLNRALEIDAENVEGLVARGALFANQNNLSKAIKDFAEALRIKPSHKNANRYMCQTLYEKGKQCEENDEKDKAMDCYQSAVDLNPDFQEALVSLQRLEKPSRRKSVKDESEEEGVISTSEESLQEQMSAKQLRDMISEEKSSTKKKKKKDKHAKGHEDGKGDRKVRKELKMDKKKKKKKLRRRSSSPEMISKQKQKEPSSDSESESSEPPSPPPKHKDSRKGSKGDNLKEPVSPEGGRLTGRKRSRNGSLSPKRKSRSKTRKADLIRKKSKNASETSSSEDDKPVEQKPKKDKKNHSKSLERSDITKAKRKGDKSRSRKESESSSVVSSSEREQVKKSKKESKKEGKDRSVKEEVSHKKRKLKTKKEKVKRSRSSTSVSEDSADSLSYSPMRKKSKQSKKGKKMQKRSKKRSESLSSSSASGSDSERKPSPPRKVHKKRKKNKKKKTKKKERSASVSSPSVVSSESPERPKSPEEHAKKRKHKKKTKEEDHYSDRYSSDSSSSSKQAKVSKGKKEINTRMDDKSQALSDRRSRSASVGLKERAPKVSSDEGEDIKIGKKRSRSNDFGLAKVKDHPKRQSKESVHSPPSERQRRRKRTSDEASDESEERHMRRKEERTRKKHSESPVEERPKSGGIEKTKNKEKRGKGEDEDRSSRRSKRHSKAHSPVEQRREKSLSLERSMSKDRDKKKSRKSVSPAPLSPHRGGHSEDRKQDKVAKPSEYRNERSRSREKHKADDEQDKKKPRRSYSSSESPPRTRSPEDKKQEKSAKHSKSREENLEKSSRRSRSLSPKTRKGEEKEQRTPVRERKRKRSGSFKTESRLPEKDKPDRKSQGGENYEEKERQRKESESETHKRKDSPRESSHRSKSADDRVDRRESPKESKKNHSRHSPSHSERNDDRHRSTPSHAERNDRRRSSVEVDQNRHSRSRRSASADKQDRKQRSKSGSYDRDKEHDRRPGEKDRDMDRRESKGMSRRESKDVSGRESKDASRRKSGSLDREDHYRERHLSDGDRHQHRSSEDTKQKSSERERPRSREDDRKRESRNADRRTSYEARKDDRERERDRSNEKQDHDRDRPSRRKSRERERSKERDRRESGKNADSSRERRDRSRESERQVSGSKSESSRRDKKVQSEASKENGKVGTKGQESGSAKNAPALNVQDIPMPPEKAPVVETKKEPSPILYVTSSSCKDEIIKVKSKWDTDSEDDESGASGPQNQRGAGGGRGTSGFQRSYGQSSQYSGSNGSSGAGGGQNYGGYSRHAEDNSHDNTSSMKNCSVAPHICLHLSLAAEQLSYHEPLRLRGGCVASPPPKYESDYSDSDVSFSSSSYVDSEEPKRDSSREGRQRRHKSSSSDRSSGGREKKRFKPSSRRESRSSSHSSSRSSSASSSRSHSSRSSSRSDISYSSRSHSPSPSSRSSSSYSLRSHSSDSKSSKASQSHVKSSDSSDKPTKTQSLEDAESDTESSDAEGASAYNLFDSWEDYMDSKGHSIGKEVPSSVIDKRTVKLEAGGSIVGKGSRRSPVSTSGEERSEDDEKKENPNPIETDENIEKKVRKTAQNKRVADDNISGGNAKYSRPSDDVTENERKSEINAAENKQSRSMGDAQNLSQHKETKHEKHSRKRGDTTSEMEKVETRQYRDSIADIQYSYGRDYERREAHTDSREPYRHSSSSDGGYSSGYGNQLKVGYSHVSHHDHPNADRGYHAGDRPVRDHPGNRYNDGRWYRSDRSREDDRHLPRRAYPQQEVRRDFRQHPERGFESQRYRRREHGFRRRRDDDDWGRGVTEVKERGTFFELVTNSKEDLVSKLYSVCSTASKLLHVHGEHRQWWL